MNNAPLLPSYPRKAMVFTSLGHLEEISVDDLLPQSPTMIALFQAGGWSTREMRMQVFETFKPYLHSREDTWIFGYHGGMYQAKKSRWRYAGYETGSWSELLNLIVRYYYTYGGNGGQ